MTTVKRIGVLSSGKVYAVISGAFGLLFGAFFSLASLIGFGLSTATGQEGAVGILLGAGAVVVLPIFYGLIGFVGGVIQAWVYNLAAGVIGGVEVEFG